MRVLIVDDEPISRRLLQNYLVKWGYEVEVAENGSRAWQMFQEGNYRMVISDWLMPEMDGLELVRRIRDYPSTNYVYAILVTVRAQKEDLVQAMEAGADDFISKPFDRDELRVRMREGERIIQLQQTLSDQNQRLAQAERVLMERNPGENHSSAASLASALHDPLAQLHECASTMHSALTRLANIDDDLRRTQARISATTPELADSISRLAGECILSRETIERRLDECDQHLKRIDELLQSFGK